MVINPLTPTVAIRVHATPIKHPVPDRIKPSFVIFDIRPGTLMLRAEHQSAWMSKIATDGLIRSGVAQGA